MLKKLITVASLIVGSSTAALAAPYHGNVGHGPVVRDHRAPTQVVRVQPQTRFRNERPVERPRYERPRYERPVYARPRAEYRWFRPRIVERAPIVETTAYVAPTYISSGYEAPMAGQQYLALGNVAGEGIELTGSGVVSEVAVHYADGRTVFMQIGQDIGGALDLQTDGSAIAGVTVYGNVAVSAAVI
jgi:hypothetical protein